MSSDTQLFDTILRALGRDDGLRRAYLQRCWQGQAEVRERSVSSQGQIGDASVPPLRLKGEASQRHGLKLPCRYRR